MVKSLSDWLESEGFGAYQPVFIEHEIDFDILADLTESDLAEMGIPIGVRKRMARAIQDCLVVGEDRKKNRLESIASNTSETITEIDNSITAENRHMSIMFCDLVGSTSLSETLDPENLREVISLFRDTCAQIIKKYDGYLANYLGDGILVYFGYPRARENDAERAVRAGMDMIAAVAALTTPSLNELKIRIGIATGYVVAGDLVGSAASESLSVLGDIPNLAARLQSVAKPNKLVVSEGTHRLLKNLFTFENLGERDLKGISQLVTVWQVIGENSAYKKSGFMASPDLTELVGRADVMSMFDHCWNRASQGEGQVILLSSDPGVGKSRILNEFYTSLDKFDISTAFWFCSSFNATSPLHPVIKFLEKSAGFEKGDDSTTRINKLVKLLNDQEITDQESIILVIQLLKLPLHPYYEPLSLSPQNKRAKSFEVIIKLMRHLSLTTPLFVVVEDVQWSDPSTMEILDQMVSRFRTEKILIVISYRTGFNSPWSGQPNIHQYTLNHFDHEESAKMLMAVAGHHKLPEQLLELILERTDGIALYIEELTKSILDLDLFSEDGGRYVTTKSVNKLQIPESLHDLLLSRLDTLGTAKELAQIGAVYGRQFPHELIAVISQLHRTAFDDAITKLVSSGLISRHGFGHDAVYEYKSGLIRDAAYESLLRSHKRELHEAIAIALETDFSMLWKGQPEIIAHHFSEAQAHEKAVYHWQQAATMALDHSAYREAISHAEEGLTSAKSLTDNNKRFDAELDLQLTLGPALMTLHGYASSGVGDAYSRATELAKHLKDNARLFTATWGQWLVQQQGGNMDYAQELAEEVLHLAEELDELEFRLQAHHAIWTTAYRQGEFAKCLEHAKRGAAMFIPDKHGCHSSSYGGHDAGTCANNHAALSSWFLGENEQAEKFISTARQIADGLEQPFSQALARVFAAQLYRYMDDPQQTNHFAEEALEISRENGFGQLVAQAELLRGWSLALQSSINDGVKVMEQALENFIVTGAGGRRGSFLPALADIQIRNEDYSGALKTLEKAHAINIKSGESTAESEIYYLQGLALSESGAKKNKIREALDMAWDLSKINGANVIGSRVSALLERL